jgi:hypothetical protein
MSVKHSSQLVCACSEDAAMDAVWTGSLARVKMFKCLTNVGHRGEPQSLVAGTVLSSKCAKVFSLSGSKTSVSMNVTDFSFCSP